MGIYTGTAGDDEMRPGYLSSGVTANPSGTTPGNAGDTLYGKGGNDDRLLIDASGFQGGLDRGGHLARDRFQAGEGHQARDAEIRFLFDTRDATLWFDRNGDASGGLSLVADLQAGAQLTHEDVWMI